MAATIGRRELLSFGFLRRARPERQRELDLDAAAPTPADRFSLEAFYRQRRSDGVSNEPLPPLAIRVLPESD